jgi:hypothetical protein
MCENGAIVLVFERADGSRIYTVTDESGGLLRAGRLRTGARATPDH